MPNLLLAAAAFVLLHRGISGTPLRGAIVRRTGETAYARMFQFVSVAAVVWLGIAYAAAQSRGASALLWTAQPVLQNIQIIVQPLALLLVLAGVSTPNPGTFRQEAVADEPEAVRGMLRITRHPFLWGIALFAFGHLIATPSARNLVLFGTLFFVALTGTRSIDRKRERALGPQWRDFAARTSNLPFAAIIAGRQRLAPAEIGWGRVAAAVTLSIVLMLIHPLLFGVPAVP